MQTRLIFLYFNMINQSVNLIFSDILGLKIVACVGNLTDSEIIHLSDIKTRFYSDVHKNLLGYNSFGLEIYRDSRADPNDIDCKG